MVIRWLLASIRVTVPFARSTRNLDSSVDSVFDAAVIYSFLRSSSGNLLLTHIPHRIIGEMWAVAQDTSVMGQSRFRRLGGNYNETQDGCSLLPIINWLLSVCVTLPRLTIRTGIVTIYRPCKRWSAAEAFEHGLFLTLIDLTRNYLLIERANPRFHLVSELQLRSPASYCSNCVEDSFTVRRLALTR